MHAHKILVNQPVKLVQQLQRAKSSITHVQNLNDRGKRLHFTFFLNGNTTVIISDLCVIIFVFAAASLSVLRIGSMDPGALLNDAFKEFEVSKSLSFHTT